MDINAMFGLDGVFGPTSQMEHSTLNATLYLNVESISIFSIFPHIPKNTVLLAIANELLHIFQEQ